MQSPTCRRVLLVASLLIGIATAAPASMLVDHLAAGLNQTMVTYGTSLTAGGSWPGLTRDWLNSLPYTGKVTLVNSGASGQASPYGVANLTTAVLAYNPNAVFIEFAVNDAYTPYALTLTQCRDNLNSMIDSILAHDAGTEVILQTMNLAWDNPLNGYQSATLRPNLTQYYQVYRDVATTRSLLLIDHTPNWQTLYGTPGPSAAYQAAVPDGIHPSAAAESSVMMPTIKEALLPGGPPAGGGGGSGTLAGLTVVKPVAVTASSEYADGVRGAIRAINGSGLASALPTGTAAPSPWPAHDANYQNMWLTNTGDATPTITFDLGEATSVVGVHAWNQNEGVWSVRGIKDVTVTFSLNGTLFDSPAVFTGTNAFQQANGLDTYTGADYFFGAARQARWVRFSVASNWGNGYTGLSEVRFLVPEPAAGVLLLALAGSCLSRRRTRK